MQLRPLDARTVGVVVGAAAAGGLLVGALIGAVGEQGNNGTRTGASLQRPGIPPFRVFSPTATPRPDHPSPDFGNLTGLRRGNGHTVLQFDRVTLKGSQERGYSIDNKAHRLRERRLSEDATVIGGEKLTQQPEPREIPLTTLLTYLEQSAKDDPLLVWLRYDDSGQVVEVREQNLP